jgi:hypothetical protein
LTNSDFVLDPFNKLIATDAVLDGKELAPRVDDVFDRFRDARPDPLSPSAEFVARHAVHRHHRESAASACSRLARSVLASALMTGLPGLEANWRSRTHAASASAVIVLWRPTSKVAGALP